MKEPIMGETMDVVKLQKGLRTLCPDISFDMGANLNIWHPQINQWMGVHYCGKHLCSMDRGPLIPEYNVYSVRTTPLGQSERDRVLRIGWRTTMEKLVRKKVPNVTWERLCLVFGIEYKKFNGHYSELEVA